MLARPHLVDASDDFLLQEFLIMPKVNDDDSARDLAHRRRRRRLARQERLAN